MRNLKYAPVVVAGISAAVLSGCTRDTPEPTVPQSAESSSVRAVPQVSPQQSAPAIRPGTDAAKNALRTAASAIPDGRVFDLETDDRSGEFEAKVASAGNEFKVRVGPAGTGVLSQRQADKASDDIAKLDQAQIPAGEAIDRAVRDLAAHDVFFDEMEIDRNSDGALVWQVTLVTSDATDHEFDVDATTGTVTRR